MHHIERSFHSWLLRQKHFEYRYRSINLHESREREARNSEFKYHLKHISFLIQSWYNCEVKTAQSCLTLCNPIDYTVHGILQASILEGVAVPFSGRSSQPRDQTEVSCIAGGFFTIWVTREAQEYWSGEPIPSPADLPDPGNQTGVSCIAGGFFTSWATREAPIVADTV